MIIVIIDKARRRVGARSRNLGESKEKACKQLYMVRERERERERETDRQTDRQRETERERVEKETGGEWLTGANTQNIPYSNKGA